MEFSGSFVIRVYAIIINKNSEVLITDEFQMNQRMTKFPGGGLILGEGRIDCLIREIKEECNGQKIKTIRHFYTTDFYQKALFYENKQLISIYYIAEFDGPVVFPVSDSAFDFTKMENGNQSFRWIKTDLIDPELFTFHIDKVVALKIKKYTHEKN